MSTKLSAGDPPWWLQRNDATGEWFDIRIRSLEEEGCRVIKNQNYKIPMENEHKKLLFGNAEDQQSSVKTKENVLFRTRCYLIGHMQYSDGRGWRDVIKQRLANRNITFFDPYHKPFINEIPEDERSRDEMHHWMETEQYDLVQQRMWQVRSHDLRLCDICDFFIAHIIPEKASWGSAEEITTVIREKKPLFLSIEGGKKKTPLWIMGAVPHKYIYNNVEEVMTMVENIDDNIVRINSDRWKLLKPELR